MDSAGPALKFIVTQLLLPPGCILVLLALALAAGPHRRWARRLAACSLVLLAIVAIPAFVLPVVRLVEGAYPPLTPQSIATLPRKGVAIVVLTSGKKVNAIEYPGGETASPESVQRARYAVWLARQTGLPVVLSGGSPGQRGRSQASVLADFVQNEIGTPVAKVEGESTDTRHSARALQDPLAAAGVRTVVIVTDVLHMHRAVLAYEMHGFTVVPAPMAFETRAGMHWTDFLPTARALQISSYLWQEAIGYVWYRVGPDARRAANATGPQ